MRINEDQQDEKIERKPFVGGKVCLHIVLDLCTLTYHPREGHGDSENVGKDETGLRGGDVLRCAYAEHRNGEGKA